MSKSYWLYCAAIGGCLVAFSWVSYAQDDRDQKGSTPPAPQAQPSPKPSLPISVTGTVRVEREKEIEPDWNKLKCSEAKSHDEADLCEQRRMSEAAERAVYLNAAQVVIGFVGFIALIWNLYYVRQSTRAAIDAATAAGIQAQTAEDALTKLQRPYIFLTDVRRLAGTPRLPVVHCVVTNHGQAPAVIEWSGASISQGLSPAAPERDGDDHPFVISPILNANERRSVQAADGPLPLKTIDLQVSGGVQSVIVPNWDGPEELFFWIRIKYRGPLTAGHESSGCWRYDRDGYRFVRHGDEHNYTR